MIKFAIAGKLDYFKKGKEKLKDNGYIPKLEIINSKVIDHKKEIKRKNLELLICLAHPYILTEEEINLFPKGCINFHAGIPNYCGRHPIRWMLIDGVKKTPATVHYMTKEIDGGDIIVEDLLLIERDDDYKSVLDKLTNLGSNLLLAAIKQIESNTVYRKKQVEQRRYQKKRTPGDSKIDWEKRSYDLHNFIRALVDPTPNSFAFTEKGKKIQFKKSFIGKNIGEILAETIDGNYVISTKDGIILVETDKKLKIGDKFNTKK